MITTQGDREMHSNISINLSKKSNSKRSYPTETRTYNNSRNTSSQTLYAQAVNWQLKNPAPARRTTTSTNWTATQTRTVNSTRTAATTTNFNMRFSLIIWPQIKSKCWSCGLKGVSLVPLG